MLFLNFKSRNLRLRPANRQYFTGAMNCSAAELFNKNNKKKGDLCLECAKKKKKLVNAKKAEEANVAGIIIARASAMAAVNRKSVIIKTMVVNYGIR